MRRLRRRKARLGRWVAYLSLLLVLFLVLHVVDAVVYPAFRVQVIGTLLITLGLSFVLYLVAVTRAHIARWKYVVDAERKALNPDDQPRPGVTLLLIFLPYAAFVLPNDGHWPITEIFDLLKGPAVGLPERAYDFLVRYGQFLWDSSLTELSVELFRWLVPIAMLAQTLQSVLWIRKRWRHRRRQDPLSALSVIIVLIFIAVIAVEWPETMQPGAGDTITAENPRMEPNGG